MSKSKAKRHSKTERKVKFKPDAFEVPKFLSEEFEDMPSHWKTHKGKNVKVAVLDTGIWRKKNTNGEWQVHGAFRDLNITGRNFVIENADSLDESELSAISEDYTDTSPNGHGTHMTGIIAANPYNEEFQGVAPKVDLYIGRVMSDANFLNPKHLAAGINWAIEQEVDIISMSLGLRSNQDCVSNAIRKAHEACIFLVAAAGNGGPMNNTVNYPAKYCETIAVSNVKNDFNLVGDSGRGSQVDYAAPGVNTFSTGLDDAYSKEEGGTSQAAASIAGVVALIISAHRNVEDPETIRTPVNNLKQLKAHLMRAAKDDQDEFGIDFNMGYGYIDVDKILNYNQNN